MAKTNIETPGWPPVGWVHSGEACERLGVSRPTLHSYANRGLIRAAKPDGLFWVWHEGDVDRLAKQLAKANEALERQTSDHELISLETLASHLGQRTDDVWRAWRERLIRSIRLDNSGQPLFASSQVVTISAAWPEIQRRLTRRADRVYPAR